MFYLLRGHELPFSESLKEDFLPVVFLSKLLQMLRLPSLLSFDLYGPRASSAPKAARRRQRPRWDTAPAAEGDDGFSKNAFLKNAFFENFANFWRARSRLYQNEILQENMRSTAFFKLYKICILLHRCNLKIFAKNRFEKTAIFVKFQQKNCKCRKICKILSNFKKFSLRIW